jgi:hypothetical protein
LKKLWQRQSLCAPGRETLRSARTVLHAVSPDYLFSTHNRVLAPAARLQAEKDWGKNRWGAGEDIYWHELGVHPMANLLERAMNHSAGETTLPRGGWIKSVG